MSGVQDWQLEEGPTRVTREDGESGGFRLTVAGAGEPRELAGQLLGARPGWVTLRLGDRTYRARVLRQGDTVTVAVAGETHVFAPPRRGGGAGGAGGDGRVESPMPGAVLEVLVAEGDAVEKGQALVVVEAMKEMEHRLKAAFDGVVEGLTVAAGDRCDAGQLLMKVVPAE